MASAQPVSQSAGYVQNPLYAEALEAFRAVEARLWPAVMRVSRGLMEHRMHVPAFVKIRPQRQRDAAMMHFRLTTLPGLIEDGLDGPDGIAALQASGGDQLAAMRALLEGDRADAWQRDYLGYVSEVLAAGREIYGLAQEEIWELMGTQAFEENWLQARLTGEPAGGKSAVFTIQFDAAVFQGWHKCPHCQANIPDHEFYRDQRGEPVCLEPDCIQQMRA